MQRVAIDIEAGELGGAAVELELVAREGLEPVLERVLQRPRYDRLHGRPPPSGGELFGAVLRCRCRRRWRACRRIGGEIPAGWRGRRGTDRVGEVVKGGGGGPF